LRENNQKNLPNGKVKGIKTGNQKFGKGRIFLIKSIMKLISQNFIHKYNRKEEALFGVVENQ